MSNEQRSKKMKQVATKSTQEHDVDQYLNQDAFEPKDKQITQKVGDKRKNRDSLDDNTKQLLDKIIKVHASTQDEIFSLFTIRRRNAFKFGKPTGLTFLGIQSYLKGGPLSLLKYIQDSEDLGNPVLGVCYNKVSEVLEDGHGGNGGKLDWCRVLLARADWWYFLNKNIRIQLAESNVALDYYDSWDKLKESAEELWNTDEAEVFKNIVDPDDKDKTKNVFGKDNDFEDVWNRMLSMWNNEVTETQGSKKHEITKAKIKLNFNK